MAATGERGRPRSRAARAVLLLAGLNGAALLPSWAGAAQEVASRPARTLEVRVGAAERFLWLSLRDAAGSHLFGREVNRPFSPGLPLQRGVKALQPVGDGREVLVFFDDHSLHRFRDGDFSAERDLPARDLPLALAADGSGLYAIVRAATAAAIRVPIVPESDAATPTQPFEDPFDPGESPLALVAYRRGVWRPLARLPADLDAPDAPRLGVLDDAAAIFLLAERGVSSQTLRRDGSWSQREELFACSALGAWPLLFDQVPYLATVERGADGAPQLHAYRRLGGAWLPASLEGSPLPVGVKPERIEHPFAFNQHVGALVRDEADHAYLQFYRVGEPVSMPTVTIADLLSQRPPTSWVPFQTLMLVVLFGVFATLFVFRRDSMVATIPLPAEWELALTSRRVGAWLVDAFPFTVGATFALRTAGGLHASLLDPDLWREWAAVLQALTKWAIVGDIAQIAPLPGNPLLWWALSAGGFTAYALIMELIAGRTIGKLLFGVHVISSHGGRPRLGQVFIRNVARLLELVPPLWAISFLAVLTRNRQRLGDIFARTVCVQRATIAPDSSGSDPPNADPP
ncbi:MAG: hypothetical protein CHACPFDD_00495 [Phycisphaerae bacterium]|nr:hypothetical protein [Phycisphaerae bacterium]